MSQQQQRQTLFEVELTLESGKKKIVPVKATVPAVAEHRALKRNPAAVSAKWVGRRS